MMNTDQEQINNSFLEDLFETAEAEIPRVNRDFLKLDGYELLTYVLENYVSASDIKLVNKKLKSHEFSKALKLYCRNKLKEYIETQQCKEKEKPKTTEKNFDVKKKCDLLHQAYKKALIDGNCYNAINTCCLMIDELNLMAHNKEISNEVAYKFQETCLIKYSYILDDISEEGLNNYSEEILSLESWLDNATNTKVNEVQCHKWKSNLKAITDNDLPQSIIQPSVQSIYSPLFPKFVNLKKNIIEIELTEEMAMKLVMTKTLNVLESSFLDKVFNLSINSSSNNKKLLKHSINNAFPKMIKTSPSISKPLYNESSEHKMFIEPIMPDKINSPSANNNRSVNMETVIMSASKRQKICHEYESTDLNLNKESKKSTPPFKTARAIMADQKNNKSSNNNNRKCLGTRRGPSSKFITPIRQQEEEEEKQEKEKEAEEIGDERLKGIDPKMVEIMMSEIMDHDSPVLWDDIAGLEFVKTTLQEIVVWPLLRPDIFTGLRGPPKGILLFGPPGTGKTLIGKCVASQSKSTFFSISASSLGSKWYGEGEKLVRALFTVARCYQPAVIFIDEIDSLLTQRSDNDHETSRRVKTEFLVQLDGVKSIGDERLLIIGATNRPQELDEAARRRLVKRLYVPLPEAHARIQIIKTLLANQNHKLSDQDYNILKEKTDGYSGADMANLCKEAALGPIRSINLDDIASITSDEVRPIQIIDFIKALKQVRASVSDADLNLYEEWNKKYGSFSDYES